MNVDPLKLTPEPLAPLTDIQYVARLAGAAAQLASMCLTCNSPDWAKKGAESVFDMIFDGETNAVGVDFAEHRKPEEPAPKSTPKAVLHWPPRPPESLPAVYAENYYEVRHGVLMKEDTTLDSFVTLETGDTLAYTGHSEWSREARQWAMRMCVGDGPHAGKFVWAWTFDIKPGDEISDQPPTDATPPDDAEESE